jgi:catechol 2,3-dioxygenase-like lactoylglutathione lyase family enzyme
MSTITYSTIKKMSPQLLVADLEGSIAFYTRKLGFEVEFRYEDFYVGIIKDGFSINLKCGDPSSEERKNKRQNEELDIVFSVEGVEDLFSECLGRSIEILQPLREMPYGKEFYIADPDGHILAFLEEARGSDNR